MRKLLALAAVLLLAGCSRPSISWPRRPLARAPARRPTAEWKFATRAIGLR